MPIVVQREVVVFLVFFSVRVENIFDENTKYCRFLTHASHVFNFKYLLCTKADDDDDDDVF